MAPRFGKLVSDREGEVLYATCPRGEQSSKRQVGFLMPILSATSSSTIHPPPRPSIRREKSAIREEERMLSPGRRGPFAQEQKGEDEG